MSREGSPREETNDGLESSNHHQIKTKKIKAFIVDLFLADQPISIMDVGSAESQGKSKVSIYSNKFFR